MKNPLLFFLAIPLIFLACSNSDNDETPKVTSIKIANLTQDVYIGTEMQLAVNHTPVNLDAPDYTWESSNPSVATISNNGILKAIKEGQVSIVVSALALNLTSSIDIAILPIKATSIKLDKQSNVVTVGESFTLNYVIVPDNTTNKSVTWTSSDQSIATVSQDGVVTAVSDGEAIITVSLGSLKDECLVTVNPIKVASISLNLTSISIENFESYQLIATLAPSNAKNKNVTWSSSDESVASVDNSGYVTTKKVGNVTIKATTVDGGFTASASVEVYSFTKNIWTKRTSGSVTSPWGSWVSMGADLVNGSNKTIVAKKFIIYEDGVFLSSQDINDTLSPGATVSYSIRRTGNFIFEYEYEFDGITYSTLLILEH